MHHASCITQSAERINSSKLNLVIELRPLISNFENKRVMLQKIIPFLVFGIFSITGLGQWNLSGNTVATSTSVLGPIGNQPLRLMSNSEVKMTILPSASIRVGIGTENPNYNLHIHGKGINAYDAKGTPIQGSVSSEGCIQLTNNTSGVTPLSGLRIGLLDDVAYFSCVDKLRMRIINGAADMRLNNQGRIDFFSESPFILSKFNIHASQDNGVTIDKRFGEGTFGLCVWTGNTNTNAIIVASGMSFTPSFVVKNDGRVGIGIANPSADYKLDVAGKMRACEVRVNNPGWCDYVFAEGYDLMPLTQLGDYIRLNHHLPEMPSQLEVEAAGGFDVAAISIALLKRSEENTLYILELEHTLQRAQEQSDEQAKKIAALEAAIEKLVATKN